MIEPETKEQEKAYTVRLEKHITCVIEAGIKLGLSKSQMYNHDVTKWEVEEFGPYARMFVNSDGSYVDDYTPKPKPDTYIYAWLHHIHHNMHHWQHWIFPDRWSPRNSSLINGVMKMPERYALEMIADWQGASKAYTGSWNMGPWLIKNAATITVHPETAHFLKEQLTNIGYGDIMQVAIFNSP